MELANNNSSTFSNEHTLESIPVVLMTYGYEKEKVNGKKLINGNFEILEKIGEGSFWTVFKVERSVIDEFIDQKSYHVFKEGKLSFSLPNEDFLAENDVIDECVEKHDDPKKYEFDSLNKDQDNQLNYESSNNNIENYDLDNIYSDENIKIDERLGLKELFIMRRINQKNIARLYECIIDESLDKIVFVMEYCDLGQLMKYNDDETGYEYNKNLIIFLLKKLFYENNGNQREIILDIINFNVESSNLLSIKDLMDNFTSIDDDNENIEMKIESEKFIFELFDKNFKLKVYLAKIIIKQILEGIKYLHSKNICNRDIKPENIVFKNTFDSNLNEHGNINIPDDFVKIIDFSIGKLYSNKNQKIISVCGSDLFKSPEMLNFEYFNPFKAEIYSVGVAMIYFLFKKFFKSNKIKEVNEAEKNMKIENLTMEENNNHSKFIIMRSNSLLNRPRKSSIIYNNYEKKLIKEYFNDIEEIKPFFEIVNELHFYDILKGLVNDNPNERLNLEEINLNF